MSMRFLSLFTGIGGFDLGLERAGMECVGQVENDEKLYLWLNYYWPNVLKIKDIYDVKGDEFGAVELVCGGFPCQPHSCAGKRLGTKDDRFLWPQMYRVIQAVSPIWVIAENVPALDDKNEMVLDRTITNLEDIGYEVGPPLEIPACGVGAPHKRARLFIVGHSNSERLQGEKQGGAPGSISKPSGINFFWSNSKNSKYIKCSDGKTRRVPATKSGVCPVAHGVPGRMAKLRGYGNAIIPQIAEIIGRSILIASKEEEECYGNDTKRE
jgi:DNA (cytosine-5)-methyltransferase 1